MNTGDKVIYTADVHKDYQNQIGEIFDFDLKYRLASIRFKDGTIIPVFYDEIKEVYCKTGQMIGL